MDAVAGAQPRKEREAVTSMRAPQRCGGLLKTGDEKGIEYEDRR